MFACCVRPFVKTKVAKLEWTLAKLTKADQLVNFVPESKCIEAAMLAEDADHLGEHSVRMVEAEIAEEPLR